MTSSRRLTLLFLLELAAACYRSRRDTIRTDVVGGLQDLTVNLSLCSRKASDPAARVIEFVKIYAHGQREDICTAWAEPGTTIGNAWTYGETRERLHLKGCDKLDSGDYVISALSSDPRYQMGFLFVALAEDGTVAEKDSACK